MTTDLQTLLDTVADLREKANVNAVFGEPVTVEGHTVIPVARVGYAFGLAGGHLDASEEEAADKSTEETADKAEEGMPTETKGSASIGGVKAHPMAIIVITPAGAQVQPLVDEQKLSLAGAMLAGWGILCLARTLVRIFGPRD